jgi:hypothetical protein
LEILDAVGRVIRRYASTDSVEKIDPATVPVPIYWYRPPQTLGATAGMHRFLWDMRYQPLPGSGGRGGLPISATPFNTVPTPNAIWAPPGKYTVRLAVGGKSLTQPLSLRLDPRVKTPAAEIARISELSVSLNEGAIWSQAAVLQVRAVRTEVKTLIEKAGQAPIAKELADFDKTAAAFEGSGGAPGGQRGAGGGPQGAGVVGGQDTFSGMGGSLTPLMTSLQAADVAPPDALAAAIADRLRALNVLKGKWNGFKTADLAGMNARLKAAGLPAIEIK